VGEPGEGFIGDHEEGIAGVRILYPHNGIDRSAVSLCDEGRNTQIAEGIR
jgi:hypothetical protein